MPQMAQARAVLDLLMPRPANDRQQNYVSSNAIHSFVVVRHRDFRPYLSK